MEKILEKMARQLNAYDEASLMALWEKYAERVQHFEPTKRWEEAALVFGFIQSMRWKNQLFNYHWAESTRHVGEAPPVRPAPDDLLSLQSVDQPLRKGPAGGDGGKQRTKVLRFRPREDDETT